MTRPTISPWRVAVAPMLDWTTPHCRHLHRQLSQHTRLYTEMIHANAIVLGDAARHLSHSLHTSPSRCALQLGGSDPIQLAQAARIAVDYGYDEINLNCGCPSPRVQSGNFGACLMSTPHLVAECVDAMRQAVTVPITVKHRLGVDRQWSDEELHQFIAPVHAAGCTVFIVHARIAVLKGLSPKDNRSIPPLRYDAVYRLKQHYPHLTIVINGGIDTYAAIDEHLHHVDGVMVGRMAYHQPYWLSQIDARYFGAHPAATPLRQQVLIEMQTYAAQHAEYFSHVVEPMTGLAHGQTYARRWRSLCADKPRHKAIAKAWQGGDPSPFTAWWQDARALIHCDD